jgi:hypothetical protein
MRNRIAGSLVPFWALGLVAKPRIWGVCNSLRQIEILEQGSREIREICTHVTRLSKVDGPKSLAKIHRGSKGTDYEDGSNI